MNVEEEVKINVQLITKEELRYIDHHYHSLVNKYLLEYKNRRDHLFTNRLMYNLERENKRLKKQNKFLMKRENKLQVLEMKQKEFIKYLEDEIKACKAVSDLLFNSNKEIKVYKEILTKYKQIIGADNSD